MIFVTLIGHDFQYEIQHLLKAFYPQETIEFTVEKNKALDSIQIYSIWRDNGFRGEVHVDQQVYQQEHQEDLSGYEDTERGKVAKRLLKKVLYEALELYTKRSLPWGILTGIRPTKIVHELLEKGFSDGEIEKELSIKYHIQQEKIALMKKVARKEKQILDQNQPEEISLYIGIPFCPTRCVYCSFTSYPIGQWKDHIDAYTKALITEIKAFEPIYHRHPIRSIYIGGGTPTSLSAFQLQILLEAMNEFLPMKRIEEFTIEAGRPDTITLEKLQMMKAYGVERISINPQTMNNETLQKIGRNHTVEDIIQAFQMAKEVGFDCINMDLIVGLPGETLHHVQHTWEQLEGLKPDTITVHTMAIKRASKLRRNLEQYELIGEEEIEKILFFTQEQTQKMGLEPYYLYRQKNMIGNLENIGYCIPGKECIYNVEIMEEKQTIMSFGAGAVTKVVDVPKNHIQRIENVKDVSHYIQRIEEMIQRKKRVLTIDE